MLITGIAEAAKRYNMPLPTFKTRIQLIRDAGGLEWEGGRGDAYVFQTSVLDKLAREDKLGKHAKNVIKEKDKRKAK